MAIKTLFICFLQDSEESDGSTQHPYAMNNELACLVHKTNNFEKKMKTNSKHTHAHTYEYELFQLFN